MVGSGAVETLNAMYAHARGVADEIRRAQIRLLSVAVAFFGEAAIGAYRQNGVPYINNAMLPQLAQAYFALIAKSGLETVKLHQETGKVLREGSDAIAVHEELSLRKALITSEDESPNCVSESASALVLFLEED